MAFPSRLGGPSFQQPQVHLTPSPSTSSYYKLPSLSLSGPPGSYTPEINTPGPQPFVDAQFDIFEWHGSFQSCVRYFLDHAQHSGPIQAVAAFLNIQLPFQKQPHPIYSSNTVETPPPHPGHHGIHSPGFPGMSGPGPGPASLASLGKMPMQMVPSHPRQQSYVTLTPYIRRLVATGFDVPSILHGFFGDDWAAGIGPLHETERRNYLFAAKSDNWLRVKASYDMDGEQIPFLKPLQNVSEKEIVSAESSWSEWLAMQDWMLGPRAPVDVEERAQGREPRAGSRMDHHHH